MPILPPPQKVRARVNSTGTALARRVLNLIGGTGVTVASTDDPTNNEIDVTLKTTAWAPLSTGDTTSPALVWDSWGQPVMCEVVR